MTDQGKTGVHRIIDSHAHLNEIADLPIAMEKAKEAGVIGVVAVGSEYQSNLEILKISQSYPKFVYPALGLHPSELGGLSPAQIDENLQFIESRIRDIIAIGEIGLDYDKRVVKVTPKEIQKEVLRRILNLAGQYEKLVIIHSRYAWQDAFDLVLQSGIKAAVFHWFTGFSSVLKDIIQAGYFISATPAAEYHTEHQRAIKEAPINRLLLETDCPVSYGRDNRFTAQPADALRSLKAVAELKGINESIVAERTTQNAFELFHLGNV